MATKTTTQLITHYLPWDEELSGKIRLFIIGLVFFILFAVLSFMIKTTEIPELTKKQAKIPDRLVQLVVEKTKRPPPPVKIRKKPKPKKPEVKKEKPKQETKPKDTPKPVDKPIVKPKPVVKPKPIIKPQPVYVRPPKIEPIKPPPPVEKPKHTQEERQVAKQQAKKAIKKVEKELTSVRKDMSKLRNELAGISGGLRGVGTGSSASSGSSGGSDIVASRQGTGSGGIGGYGSGGASGNGYNSASGGYDDYQSASVGSSVASAQPSADIYSAPVSSGSSAAGARTNASVAAIMRRYNSAFDRIYKRALRQDASLEGAVSVHMIINTNGKVTSVSITSSDIDDTSFQTKIKAKIRGINFGPAPAEWSGPYTFNFFPQ